MLSSANLQHTRVMELLPLWQPQRMNKSLHWFSILMGINELPEIHDYSFWSTNDHLHFFWVASQFLKRFMELSTCLNLTNNENIVARGQPSNHCSSEVIPWSIQSAQRKCKEGPPQAVPPHEGHQTWAQSVGKGRRHNGFLCNLEFYTGKEESVETNLGVKVVKKLLRTPRWVRDIICTLSIFFLPFLCWRIFWKMSCMLMVPSAKTKGVFLRHIVKTTFGRWITNIYVYTGTG